MPDYVNKIIIIIILIIIIIIIIIIFLQYNNKTTLLTIRKDAKDANHRRTPNIENTNK